MELTIIDSIEDARRKLNENIGMTWLATEEAPISRCLGRTLAKDVYVTEDIPSFNRSTVDGYAVRSKDTAAAGESLPVILTSVGEVLMGARADFSVKSGECAYIPTGGMLPESADAVVMVEYSELFGEDGVALYKPAVYGENIVCAGEDAHSGGLLLERGKLIGAAEIGALAAAGLNAVPVYKKPRLTIISTGDELVTPGEKLSPGQVYDINTYALAALADKKGFGIVGASVLQDDEEILERAVRKAMAVSDVVAVSGGSSRGKKDATCAVLDKVSIPGVFTRGIAVKPGKPTILAWDEPSRTLLTGLPGHPVSAMLVFEELICGLYREITGAKRQPAVMARLSVNMPSSPGKTTFCPVSVQWNNDGYTATPVFGKSGLISTLTGADGYFEIGRGQEGLASGSAVRVHLF